MMTCYQNISAEAYNLFANYLLEVEKICFFHKSLMLGTRVEELVDKVGSAALEAYNVVFK
jgi:hypothetical protein